MGKARELMDRLTDAAMHHEVEKAVELYADDAVLMTPDAGQVKGRQNIDAYWHQMMDAFPDADYEPINKLESDNTAVDEGYLVGTNTKPMKSPDGETIPPTGKKIKIRSCDVATVKNGKIVEHRMYFDEMEFMRQLGLMNE